jgi:hypothetical protein
LTSAAAEREAERSAQGSITLFAYDFFVRVLPMHTTASGTVYSDICALLVVTA